jgi:hypothetical protein
MISGYTGRVDDLTGVSELQKKIDNSNDEKRRKQYRRTKGKKCK